MAGKKRKKRALVLSGGGPVVGIEIGALRAFEENGIDFDIYSCACVGSWVGCLYNSLPEKSDRLRQVEHFFRDKIFIPDDIYESFPIAYKVFRMDYLHDTQKLMEKLFEASTYQHLFLPDRIAEYASRWMRHPPATLDDYFYFLTEGLALNPVVRFGAELQYKIKKSGVAGLISSENFVDKYIDFDQLFKREKVVYLNAYNLSKHRMEIFINRKGHRYDDITADALMAGSSVLHYTENRTIDGKSDKYCEGAVIDTVNLDHLLTDHPDLDEIWVIKIADYKAVKPPKNLIEAALLGVMLPFDTISDDDIDLFSHRLQEHNRTQARKVRFINALMAYQDVNYHWNHSNLDEGIRVGYDGALNAISEYREKDIEKEGGRYIRSIS
jgi:predicted acylesterase/phospholipase RssA